MCGHHDPVNVLSLSYIENYFGGITHLHRNFMLDPLPFRAMGIYPYPAGKSYPLNDQHLNDLLMYNTRFLSSGESPSYRFNYAPSVSAQEKSKH